MPACGMCLCLCARACVYVCVDMHIRICVVCFIGIRLCMCT